MDGGNIVLVRHVGPARVLLERLRGASESALVHGLVGACLHCAAAAHQAGVHLARDLLVLRRMRFNRKEMSGREESAEETLEDS